jgi:exonuclease III
MYELLQQTLHRWRGIPTVLGGDWNAVFSDFPLNINPDIFSMRAVPSTARTEIILQLCEEYELTDPYRMLQPDGRDYTYVPASVLRQNRSRIDFFLMSKNMLNEVSRCEIAQGFCKKSFDHKSIFLSFKKGKKRVINVLITVYLKTNYWMSLLNLQYGNVICRKSTQPKV